ncbi:hypothetical protein [Cytobacillus sp. IB215665]|uniref:hypothetical protein n=1 Tax=Cytobacillus sp. IB215665 TaxID=3097357 RepID=UPI002A178B75|nr:hypothetical protein [Cytobacillus sp. IB215665]MDX8367154.1 hypothetical protein [Cytobacillus sp. IB215665]
MNSVRDLLSEFCKKFDLCRNDFSYSYLPAPHNPNPLPNGAVGIYIFEVDSVFLKVGKAGMKTKARFNSNHYTKNGGDSTLFNKILSNKEFLKRNLTDNGLKKTVNGLDIDNTTEWIKENIHRHEITFLTEKKTTLDLLEVFMQYYLEPIFEGRISN